MSDAMQIHARIEAILSELRSLAQRPRWGEEEREAVWRLLCESFDLDATRHDTIITPYLSGLKNHFNHPLRDAADVDAMREKIAIAPCSTFRLLTAKPQQLEQVRLPQLASHLGAIQFERHGKSLSSLALLLDQADSFDNLTELDLAHNTLSLEHIEQLTSSKLFPRLTTLGLHHCKLGLEEVKMLCARGSTNQLVDLRMSENQPGLEGFTAIFEQLCTPALERLDLHASAFSSMGKNGGDTFLGDEGLAALATSTNLRNLRALRLNFSRIGAQGLAQLATSRTVTALEELVLDTNPRVGPEGTALLATSANFEHLQHLSLASCQLGPEGAAQLANASTLDRLRVLDLCSDKLGDEGIHTLVESPIFHGVEALHIAVNHIEDEGAASLLSSRKLAALHTLSFHGNHLGERACRGLSDNEALKLESLDVSRCKLGDANGALLLGSPRLATLKHLKIKNNALGATSAYALATSTALGALETLDLSGNELDTQMCVEIFSSPSLFRLKHLYLEGNTPDAQGILALTKACFFDQLETLVLSDTGLDAAQLRLLVEGGKLSKLRRLDLSYNRLLTDIGCLLDAPLLGHLEALSLFQCNHLDTEQVGKLLAMPDLRGELREDLHRQQLERMFEYF